MNSLAGKKPGSNLLSLPPAWADVAAGVSGLLLPLAFSPFDLFPLAFFAPALLFVLWRGASPGRAAFRGFLFGLGMFGMGVSWVYVSLHLYGNMPAALAGFAVLLFVAGLSLYPALLGWLQARFFPRPGPWHPVLVLASFWVLFEWLRSWVLTGFPWLHLGYSQIDTPLAGYAPWFGVYGVSFFCAISAGLLAAGARAPEKFLKLFFPLFVLVWMAGWAVGKVEWVAPLDKPLQVTLIQGNVPLESKWQPAARRTIMDRYISMSMQAPRSDLIVWPESAIPVTRDELDPDYLENLQRLSRTAGTDFLMGIVERDNNTRRYYNSVISVSAQPGTYRKHHLVPFGEYPPLDPLFRWLMRNLQIPMSDFSAGPADQPPLMAAGQKIGVSVCYEDAFGEEVIRALPQASMLVNVSEDAWFGDSFAPHQRLQMARMRALETGRPMLRAANTGPSAFIDHHGEVVARSPQFQVHALTATVQPMRGVTPYVRFGNGPVLLFLCLLLVVAVIAPHARNRLIKSG